MKGNRKKCVVEGHVCPRGESEEEERERESLGGGRWGMGMERILRVSDDDQVFGVDEGGRVVEGSDETGVGTIDEQSGGLAVQRG